MKASDILRVKGGTRFHGPPDQPLSDAVRTMAENDIGSLVVMSHGHLVGILTFREGHPRHRRQTAAIVVRRPCAR